MPVCKVGAILPSRLRNKKREPKRGRIKWNDVFMLRTKHPPYPYRKPSRRPE